MQGKVETKQQKKPMQISTRNPYFCLYRKLSISLTSSETPVRRLIRVAVFKLSLLHRRLTDFHAEVVDVNGQAFLAYGSCMSDSKPSWWGDEVARAIVPRPVTVTVFEGISR
jgi:hypothetical protein